jgi:hypothetical protein
MTWLLIAAMLPGLHWTGGLDTAKQLTAAGIERIFVEPESRGAWQGLNFSAESDAQLSDYTAVSAPSVRRERSVGMATSIPWIEANGWRLLQGVERVWYKDVPAGRAALAAAEAYSYGVDAVLDVKSEDIASFGAMLQFLKTIDSEEGRTIADIGFVNDGSPEAQEAMKLLERRNLLFRTVQQPDPRLDLNVQLGSADFPREGAANPHEFAAHVRQELTDEKRLLRLFGSNVVLGHITAVGGVTRVHLLNYGPRGTVDRLRVRVEGSFASAKLASFDADDADVLDFTVRDGGTEFTVPRIVTYAVIDLK